MSSHADRIDLERTLTQDEFDRFAELSGDDNPLHVDSDFAAMTRFGATVAHGVFLIVILRALADRLVPGARMVEQSAMFPAPAFAGEPMHFAAEKVEDDGRRARLRMVALRADGAETCLLDARFERFGGEAP